jgi:hypothetical protein
LRRLTRHVATMTKPPIATIAGGVQTLAPPNSSINIVATTTTNKLPKLNSHPCHVTGVAP